MYTATIVYEFKEDQYEEACTLWEEHVLLIAKKQPGFVRMQFLTAPPRAMAIGTKEDASYAQAFMKTGVFKYLLEMLKPMLDGEPRPQVWDQKYYSE
ncbi:hypothetical protein [Oceanispirochaeta sp.]|uniref:hypothetical protein n=1 Tax=Oceanispirochaeta sp. TaxID=2035350 RepID=UPI002608D915|nr:hypothetical protein [Oceanispirochaeta sp.]MDA3958327.1 hypothetical protein [Oceanispirochaeta sp.]